MREAWSVNGPPSYARYKPELLRRTFRTEERPEARTVRFLPTLPDSTQSMRLNSSLPKSGICCDLANHGFQTTVDKEFSFSTRIFRRSF